LCADDPLTIDQEFACHVHHFASIYSQEMIEAFYSAAPGQTKGDNSYIDE